MIPKVEQVYPCDDYKIYLYFNDGKVKLYDASHLIEKGVFQKLKDKDFYKERCTVLNNTLAWDLSGNYDPTDCLDLDPLELYKNSIEVADPLEKARLM
ncbi:MAG: DUF2442 domain-containing protein [Leptospiraceae bacterium]|nr:DUF2442 domain-containing protein [Leptospiraceae bacterium]